MNQPLKEILEWAALQETECLDDWDAGHQSAQVAVLDILAEYQQEPSWVCLEGMTASELQAYDYGCDSTLDAVKRILDGKDCGAGVANEPWQSVRMRLLELVKNANKA